MWKFVQILFKKYKRTPTQYTFHLDNIFGRAVRVLVIIELTFINSTVLPAF